MKFSPDEIFIQLDAGVSTRHRSMHAINKRQTNYIMLYFSFGPSFEISEDILKNRIFAIGLDSFSTPFFIYSLK